MAIPLRCSRAQIYDEFSSEEQVDFFGIKEKKFIADIDNFYFSVFLDEKNDVFKIETLVSDLNDLRECFSFKDDNKLDFMGLDYYPFGLKFYNNRLRLEECFDILVCSSLPNDKTPRILVQLRARYLWMEGTKKCIKNAYRYVEKILKRYDIKVLKVKENRVDYAFHNNAVQAPEKFFDRNKLQKHCKTNFKIYNHVGNPQQDWSIDYFSIGSRKGNKVFFRFYNKSREVVEQNYKSFFIQLWFNNKMISKYDKFCLEKAFELKSYDVGLLVGRIKWYLEYGKNVELKDKLSELLKVCYADNDNTTKIRNKLKGVLPDVTVITNIEYETHTDFYRSFDKSLLLVKGKTDAKNILYRVNKIYECRKSFIDYLTKYGNTVSFVKDNKVKRKDFDDSQYLSFWKRLRSCKIGTRYQPDLLRSYERNVDIEKAKRKILSDAAVLSIHKNGLNMNDTVTDFSDVFSLLNDNDIHNMMFVDDNGEIINAEIKYGDYYTLKKRKNRQYRFLDKNKKKKENEVSSPDQVEE